MLTTSSSTCAFIPRCRVAYFLKSLFIMLLTVIVGIGDGSTCGIVPNAIHYYIIRVHTRRDSKSYYASLALNILLNSSMDICLCWSFTTFLAFSTILRSTARVTSPSACCSFLSISLA